MKKFLCLFLVLILVITPSRLVLADDTSNEIDASVISSKESLEKASNDYGTYSTDNLLKEFSNIDDGKSVNTPYNKLSKSEMIALGVPESDADKYANIQRILDEMIQTGQKLEYIDSNVVIVNSDHKLKKGNEETSIKDDDKAFIINVIEGEIDRKKVTYEEKQKAMDDLISENPFRTRYIKTFEDGSTVIVEQNQKMLSEIKSDSVNTYATVETGTIDIYGQNGFRQKTFTWTQFSPAGYYYQTLIYNYNVLNKNNDVYLTSVIGSSGGAGIFVANNEGAGVDVSETHYNGTPTIWAQGHSSYQWMCSVSLGGTISGVFNFSVNDNIWWTQIQQVAISLLYIHEYCTKY